MRRTIAYLDQFLLADIQIRLPKQDKPTGGSFLLYPPQSLWATFISNFLTTLPFFCVPEIPSTRSTIFLFFFSIKILDDE